MVTNVSVKNHQKMGSRGERRIMEGMSQTRVQYMYIWKYHNETLYITIIY
jgi:hypothetical protein